MPLHFVENTPSPEEDPTNCKSEWCFDITNNATDIIIENCKCMLIFYAWSATQVNEQILI